jgi:CBS domain-containing protein
MKVGDLMSRKPRTCSANDTLDRAARIMWDDDCGCVPVVDREKRVIGMITDRDICMAAYTQGVPLGAARIETAMAKNPICCKASDMPATAEHLMQRHKVRRLPVVDDQRRLIGVVSLADLAHAMATRQTFGGDGMTWQAIAHTLCAISAPRRFVPPSAAAE